jgi:nitroimidazol reductase NimA-like FMN-containing flavoprotein (pyridoxamine 5'-phosphate oxidase superfamily)
VLADLEEKRRALYGLIEKYFPHMQPGREYRPITDGELKRTSVYAIAVDSWSGKRNWPNHADQSDDWPPLPKDIMSA